MGGVDLFMLWKFQWTLKNFLLENEQEEIRKMTNVDPNIPLDKIDSIDISAKGLCLISKLDYSSMRFFLFIKKIF